MDRRDTYDVTALWNSTSCWCVAVTTPPDVWVGRPPRLASSHWHTYWKTHTNTHATAQRDAHNWSSAQDVHITVRW